MTARPPTSPYKFLDSYGLEDREIFFGRDRELRILESDIVVNRLVVLCARTGTGKTSLINAGVRPRLHDRGYVTYLIRVRKNPAASLQEELASDLRHHRLEGLPLDEQMTRLARKLDAPVVLFFDQFEEFFLYQFREHRGQGEQFIRDVARLYVDRHSGIHLVFSMREEFFVEMDAFRDEIPEIFHNGSNLRLRWFEPGPA